MMEVDDLVWGGGLVSLRPEKDDSVIVGIIGASANSEAYDEANYAENGGSREGFFFFFFFQIMGGWRRVLFLNPFEIRTSNLQ